MSRLQIPRFIHDVMDDPRQRGVLIAGSLSLLTVGLVPRVLAPGLPTAQEAIRAEPEIEDLFLLLAFASTATVMLGGLVSDLFRRRSLLVVGLVAILVGSLLSVVVDDGPVFYAANFGTVAAAGVVLAYGIGSVAIAYQGIPRATALGFVYAAYGAGSAASPALLTLFPVLIPGGEPGGPLGFTYDTWLAYTLTAVAAGVSLWAAYRHVPRIPGELPASRMLVVAVAAWSIAILAIVSGVLGLFGPGDPRLPMALIVGGGIALSILTLSFRRTHGAFSALRLDTRALAAALAVGISVGFAQAIPLMLLPVVFQHVLGYGQLLAMLAIAPFAVALFLAGPISGILIRRFGPRGIMSGGTLALGIANAVAALVLVYVAGQIRHLLATGPGDGGIDLPAWDYLLFVVPLVLIGGGFVLSTTVRTAIVFASTPRGLPASAAAINEVSVGLGSRVGIVVATVLSTLTALASATSMVAGVPDGDRLVDEFRQALVSLGTPRFNEIYQASIEGAPAIKTAAYAGAYMDGVTVALALGGMVGIVGALLAWLLIGRRDPLGTVFDLREERWESRAPASEGRHDG